LAAAKQTIIKEYYYHNTRTNKEDNARMLILK